MKMNDPPPAYTSSKSVSRSRTSRDEIAALAAAALRSPLPPNVSSASSNSSASVSRSSTSRGNIQNVTAAMQHSSLSGASASVSRSRTSRNEISAMANAALQSSLTPSRGPPSYRSTQTAPARPPVVGSTSMLSPTSPRSVGSTTSPISAADSKRRVRELQRAAEQASAAVPRRNTTGLLKEACATDLLFLIDTTGSMTPYIDAAKEQVRDTIAEIRRLFLNQSQVRIAVVAYKDHGNKPNIQFLDFTTSEDLAYEFLGGLSAGGGAGDYPEDVFGGIQQAINASWQQQTKVLIHIGDMPPHGRDMHDMAENCDNYPDPGSEPHGLTYEPLMKTLVRFQINYVFLRITKWTDRMAMKFALAYAAAGADSRLLSANKYHNTIGSGAGSKPREVNNPELLFTELALGEQYSTLKGLVVKAVAQSVSASTARLSVSLSRGGLKGPKKASVRPGLASIGENSAGGSNGDEIALEKTPPLWDLPGWLDNTMEVEGACPEVVVYTANTLNDMTDSDENIKMGFAQLTLRVRSKPFAKGAMRSASYARTQHSTNRYVAKAFLEGEKGVEYMIEDMRIQALCKAFALEFNGLVKIDPPLDFVVTTSLQTKADSASRRTCVSLEPFIEGTYVKYNNNQLYVKEDSDDDPFNRVAQAFSHFTFERSWGHFMVVDLQGVDNLLTDPCIHTQDPDRFKLNDLNLNEEGFKFFFAMHTCNSICQELGLKSNRDMAISGNWQFRETWPGKEPTVCCSNRLCHRIIRLVKANKSDKFVGHHWCDNCWRQLESSMTQKVCAGPGPSHKFDVSHFFYESQGRYAPSECPEHIEKDTTASTAASVGGSLWNRTKSLTVQRSISGSGW
ncbi:hypothetical protein QBC43DRAFT_319417 [Cladorrhinum sp. PSN259]|nr:hypothetical protein QBC43DRAFT_319417 [Cladorrhinum sp. PSN259]